MARKIPDPWSEQMFHILLCFGKNVTAWSLGKLFLAGYPIVQHTIAGAVRKLHHYPETVEDKTLPGQSGTGCWRGISILVCHGHHKEGFDMKPQIRLGKFHFTKQTTLPPTLSQMAEGLVVCGTLFLEIYCHMKNAPPMASPFS